MSTIRITLLTLLLLSLSACGINKIPTYEEAADAAWGQVMNQYQRRADLIPNLVETVKGYAAHEEEVLTAVTEARAKVNNINLSPDMASNPAAMQMFQQAQGQLGSALSRLLVTVERYPDLKANQNFLTLQSQLEGTENRISVARRDYIEAVRLYNTELKTIPGRWWRDFMYPEAVPRATFDISEEVKDAGAPKVNFN